MKFEKWKESYKRLAEEMKPMRFSQKVDHIWTYYKEYMFVAFIACIFVVATVVSVVNSGKEALLSGMLCNVSISMEGYNYLTVDYFDRVGGVDGKQEVWLRTMQFEWVDTSDPNQANKLDDSYTAAMSLISMVDGQTVDYILLDRESFAFFLQQEMFMDLREILTEQDLAQMAEGMLFVQAEAEDGTLSEKIPAAVNISNLPFAKDCIRAKEDIFIVFISNTPRKEACRQIWQDILAWESREGNEKAA